MSNSIVIFGGNGFIARNFIATHAEKFETIFCIDVVTNQENLPINVKYLNCNELSDDEMYNAMHSQKIKYAINFAWSGTSGSLRDDWKVQYQNVINNQKQLALCAKLGITRFFNLGSIMENELFLDVQTEDIKKNKLYALAKYNDHILSRIFCDEHQMLYVNLIITNTFGVGEDSPRLINTIITNYLNNKGLNFSKCNQLYSFIYIEDLVNIIFILLNAAQKDTRYVIGDLQCRPLREYILIIYDTLNNYTGKSILPSFSDVAQVSLSSQDLDTTKTLTHTQYKLKNSFAEGIIKTYEWKKSN